VCVCACVCVCRCVHTIRQQTASQTHKLFQDNVLHSRFPYVFFGFQNAKRIQPNFFFSKHPTARVVCRQSYPAYIFADNQPLAVTQNSLQISPLLLTCSDILQHTATYCNILQHTATYCNILQHTATHCNVQGHAVECPDSRLASNLASALALARPRSHPPAPARTRPHSRSHSRSHSCSHSQIALDGSLSHSLIHTPIHTHTTSSASSQTNDQGLASSRIIVKVIDGLARCR